MQKERIQEKLAQLKAVREELIGQREQIIANIHAQEGAIQLCELLLNEPEDEQEKTKEGETNE